MQQGPSDVASTLNNPAQVALPTQTRESQDGDGETQEKEQVELQLKEVEERIDQLTGNHIPQNPSDDLESAGGLQRESFGGADSKDAIKLPDVPCCSFLDTWDVQQFLRFFMVFGWLLFFLALVLFLWKMVF